MIPPRVRAVAIFLISAACAASAAGVVSRDGELTIKPHPPADSIRIGHSALGLAADRDGFLFVPHGNDSAHRAPLLIMLHGATQRARMFERLEPMADSAGIVVLAPDSRGVSWDAIRESFGPDIVFLNSAIAKTFDRAWIDTCRIVVGGFSDGATYALSLGVRNAKSLSGVVAFSPGFIIPVDKPQRLPVFLRHGRNDQILPIDVASRPILRQLRGAGFTVDYDEFDGPHTMRAPDASAALQWIRARGCGR